MAGILNTIEGMVGLGFLGVLGYRFHAQQQQAIARDRAAYTDVDYHRIADELFEHLMLLSGRPGVPVDLSAFVDVQSWGRSPASHYHIEYVMRLLANNTYASRVPAPALPDGATATADSGFWFLLKENGWRLQKAGPYGDHNAPHGQTNVTYQTFESGAHVSQNIGSPGANATGDQVSALDGDVTVLYDLIRSLHADAGLAFSEGEEHQAVEYAEELEHAVKAKDEPRAKVTLERIKLFLDVAQAGFTLTKSLIPEVLKLFTR